MREAESSHPSLRSACGTPESGRHANCRSPQQPPLLPISLIPASILRQMRTQGDGVLAADRRHRDDVPETSHGATQAITKTTGPDFRPPLFSEYQIGGGVQRHSPEECFRNGMNEIAGNGRKRGLDRRAAGGRENTFLAKHFRRRLPACGTLAKTFYWTVVSSFQPDTLVPARFKYFRHSINVKFATGESVFRWNKEQ